MKKITFDTVFKTIIMISLVYSLYLLTIIASNSGVGRYQFIYGGVKIDTRTGELFQFKDGKFIPVEKVIDTLQNK